MEEIKIIQYKNKFGYTTLQLEINYTKKTYKKGHFKIGADKTTKTMKEFFEIIDDLKKCNFTEVL
jgi:hypothetical protein